MGVLVKGGYDAPCKIFFSKSFDAGAQIDEVSVRLIQVTIPDMAIDARDCEHGPFPSPNPIVGGKNHFEHKTLASLLVSVQARARKVLTDIKRRVEELDARHSGSTFVHGLGLYLYIALVTGPFGYLSSDFNLLVDFIARERAMQTMKLRGTNPALAPSHLSWLGSAYCRPLARRSVKPPHSIPYH